MRDGWARCVLVAAFAFVAACKPRAGDRCGVADVTCDDDGRGALACVGGVRARVACDGRAGCRATCDQSIARAGDACVGGEACTPDAQEHLRCESGRFVSVGRCGGPAGCVVERGSIACDTSRGEAGDPCREAGARACARDARAVLECRDGRLAMRATCRGPRGCVEQPKTPACDDTLAEPGDACEPEGQAACSSDGASELRCMRGAFARVRICRHPPCKAGDDEVLCD